MSAIEYTPVAGFTIEEALERARWIARREGKKVIANINDIIMCVSQDSNIKMALNSYHEKLNLKYEIEKIRRERQK